MFNSITGTITAKLPHQIFLDNNGVEWDVCVPDSSIDMLPPVGNSAKIFTFLQHTDAAMQLFGFANDNERTLFFDLLKVEGIGAKSAVKIMSSVSSARLTELLDKGDLENLEKIPGVGKKSAGKMLLALKGKIQFHKNETVQSLTTVSAYSDVVLSLLSMGYVKQSAEQKVALLAESLKNDENFSSKSEKEREEIIFRRAIMELA